MHAGTAGKFGYRLSLGHDQNAQWRNHDALAFRANKFNVQTDYALTGDSRIRFSGGLVDANRFDGQIGEDVVLTTKPAQGYAHLVYERPNFYVRGFWNRFDSSGTQAFNPALAPFLTVTDRNGSPDVNVSADTYNIEGQHSIDLTDTLRLTYGANYRHNALSSNNISKHDDICNAAFSML